MPALWSAKENPPKIVFLQLFLISSNFCPQIFNMLLLGTRTTLQNIKIHTRSLSTWFNYLQVPGTGWHGQSFRCQVRLFPPRRSRCVYSFLKTHGQHSQVVYIRTHFSVSSPFQCWSHAIMCISLHRMYPPSNYFLVFPN